MFDFRILEIKSYIHRFYIENIVFANIVAQYKIDLIYNFTGSTQLFLDCPQLIKIQNLLFYSRNLTKSIEKIINLFMVSQVSIKSFVFRLLLKRAKYIEVQAQHVESCPADFVNLKNKSVLLKMISIYLIPPLKT